MSECSQEETAEEDYAPPSGKVPMCDQEPNDSLVDVAGMGSRRANRAVGAAACGVKGMVRVERQRKGSGSAGTDAVIAIAKEEQQCRHGI